MTDFTVAAGGGGRLGFKLKIASGGPLLQEIHGTGCGWRVVGWRWGPVRRVIVRETNTPDPINESLVVKVPDLLTDDQKPGTRHSRRSLITTRAELDQLAKNPRFRARRWAVRIA
jgi:hypothetical protein